MTTVSATQARTKLYELIDQVSKTGKRIGITKKGETKAILLSPEEVESWEETIEIMNDTKLMKDLRESMKDIKDGRVYPLEKVIKELNIDEG